jgi:hypothetical protein
MSIMVLFVNGPFWPHDGQNDMSSPKVPRVDVSKIIGVFGDGPADCARECRAAGLQIDDSKIRKWAQRERIPLDGFLTISAAHLTRRGSLLNLNDFLK